LRLPLLTIQTHTLVKVYARIALSFLAAAATLLWLVGGTARAAAPQCDPRGAITFAPNPVLEEPTASIDAGANDDCSSRLNERAYDHAPVPFAVSGEPTSHGAALPVGLSILPATPTAAAARDIVTPPVSTSVAFRVERPPRAL
jgi:hypothetical protein